MMDIIRIIKAGSVLPNSLWRARIQSGKIISPEGERDLKLISLVFSFEYYSLLVLAVLMVSFKEVLATRYAAFLFQRSPVLFMPWLLLYTFIIMIEFVNFFVRLFLMGINFSKHNLILSIFIVYNWLAIFCAFIRMLGICDFRC